MQRTSSAFSESRPCQHHFAGVRQGFTHLGVSAATERDGLAQDDLHIKPIDIERQRGGFCVSAVAGEESLQQLNVECVVGERCTLGECLCHAADYPQVRTHDPRSRVPILAESGS